MEKVLCLRMFYRWKIITSKNYFPLLFGAGTLIKTDKKYRRSQLLGKNYLTLQK